MTELPPDFWDLPPEKQEAYWKAKPFIPVDLSPLHEAGEAKPSPTRIPYPPDNVWFGEWAHPAGPLYFSRKQEDWLRWRDAEEKKRGPWRRK